MHYNEFAEKIKAKYPAYKDIDNRELSEKFIAKYPVYKEQVSFADEQTADLPEKSLLQKTADVLDSGLVKNIQNGTVSGFGGYFAGKGGEAGGALYDITHGQNPFNEDFDFKKAAWGLAKNVGNPIGLFANMTGGQSIFSKENREIGESERKRFNKIKNDYAEENPWTAFGAELLGGLPTALLPIGAAANAAKGKTALSLFAKAKAAGKAALPSSMLVGGLYGGGNALSETENMYDSKGNISKTALADALIGTGLGAALGAPVGYTAGFALPYAGAGVTAAKNGAKKAITPVRNLLKNRTEHFLGGIDKNILDDAIKSGTTLIDNADDNIINKTRGIRVRGNEKATQILGDFENARRAESFENVSGMINDHLGAKGAVKTLSEIDNAGQKIYRPLYNKAMKGGKVPVKGEPQADINFHDAITPDGNITGSEGIVDLNEGVKYFINKARSKVAYKHALHELPDNHIRVLMTAREAMDDEIAHLLKQDRAREAREITLMRNKLNDALHSFSPHLKQADEVFAKTRGLEAMVEEGRKFHLKTREELANFVKTLNPENAKAFIAGVRENLIKRLDEGATTDGTNAGLKTFNNSVLRKLEILGLDPDGTLKKKAVAETKAIKNLNEISKGSHTAEKQWSARGTNPTRWFTSFWEKAQNTGDNIWNKIAGLNDAEAAKLLTDTQALRQAHSKVYDNTVFKAPAALSKQRGQSIGVFGTQAARETQKEINPLAKALSAESGTAINKAELFGPEFKGFKGIDAINKLVEEKQGYVPAAFKRADLGEIDLIWGDEKRGLAHIIKRRGVDEGLDVKEFLANIADVIENGEMKINQKTARFEILKDNKMAVVDFVREDGKTKFLLTAYKTRKKEW
jgi:hypothetical protein